MKKLIVLLLGIILLSCTEEMLQEESSVMLKSASIKNSDQVIVKFKNDHKSSVGTFKKQVGAFTVLKVDNTQEALKELEKDMNVEWAEEDVLVQLDVVVNDSLYTNGELWNMYSDISTPSNQYGVHAIDAWNTGNTGSNEICVGIIDQGYMYSHPDLKDNAWINPNEIADNGIDDDANGYVDDVYGWDFYNNNNTVFDGEVDYHGTHVAGTIGGVKNDIGVIGVAPNVKFISGKFIDGYGGYTSDAVEAIYYMIALKAKGANIVALNNSWGGADRTRSLIAAIEDAGNAGILFIAAAGNTGDSKAHFPASYGCKNIISVASINSAGGLSSFSTYNKRTVDIGAPGEDVMSTFYDATWKYVNGQYVITGIAYYGYLSGTSMATPHVTGACVLYKASHPTATWLDIKSAILNTATPTPSLVGKVATGGRLDVSNF